MDELELCFRCCLACLECRHGVDCVVLRVRHVYSVLDKHGTGSSLSSRGRRLLCDRERMLREEIEAGSPAERALTFGVS